MSLYLVYQHNPTFGGTNLIAAFGMREDCNKFVQDLSNTYRTIPFTVRESTEIGAWNTLGNSAMEQA